MSTIWRKRRAVLGLCAFVAACGTPTKTPATQFIVRITSDLSPETELSRIQVTLSKRDGSDVVSMRDFDLVAAQPKTGQQKLPLTFSIGKGTQSSFLLDVVGYGPLGADKAEEKIIEQTAIGTFDQGKTVLLEIFLGRVCLGQLCDVAAEQVCYPADVGILKAGECGAVIVHDSSNSKVLDPSARLPPVAPAHEGTGGVRSETGHEAGAGGQAGGVLDAGPDAGLDAGPGVHEGGPADAARDARPVGQADAGIDAGKDSGPSTITDSTIAVANEPCAQNGDNACSGHASVERLVCMSGSWLLAGSCTGNTRCDATPGATQGTCLDMASLCIGRAPGDEVCDGATRRRCDADLLRYEADECPANAHCADAGGVSCVCDSGYENDGAGGCRNIDNCPGNTCGAGGACVDGVNDYSCTCMSGYTGTGSKVCSNIDNCPGNTCGAGGACVDGVNDYSCTCMSGYTGTGSKVCSPAACFVCTSDYACQQPAPPAYYCSGQFAEWPMPDKAAGAQTAPSYTTASTTVTDNVTHLVWQRNLPATYPGCSGNSSVAGDTCTWAEAKTYCASTALASSLGGSGWRLPTKIELESIIDETVINPAIDSTVFPGTPADFFWTASPDADLIDPGCSADCAWYVYFTAGLSGAFPVADAHHVRCVR